MSLFQVKRKPLEIKRDAEIPTFGTPIIHESNIVANVWPSESIYSRDLRFHFHSKYPYAEAEKVKQVLTIFTKNVKQNPMTLHTQAIVESASISHIENRLIALGLSIKWIRIDK